MEMPEIRPLDDALRQLQDYGLEVTDLVTSGTYQHVRHVDDKGGKKTGWYIASLYTTRAGREIVVGAYGWWKDPDNQQRFRGQTRGLSDEERQEMRQAAARVSAEGERARAQRADEAARRAAEIWPKLPDSGSSAYLDRKGVRAYGLRFSRGSVVVPLRTGDRRLVGLQFIDPTGAKRFLTGTAKQGAFHLVGDAGESPAVVAVAEGYATAATVHQAAGWPTACAFDAGNLKPVAQALRARYPGTLLVFCADDDRATPGNPGRSKAEAAARMVGGMVVLPPLGEHPGTDFNDLLAATGMDAVRDALLTEFGRLKPPEPPQNVVQGEFPGRDWQARLQRNDRGHLRSTAFNLRLILEHDPAWKGVLGWCLLSALVIKRRSPPYANASRGEWDDADDGELRFWVAEHYGIEPKGQDLADPIMGVARGAPFHPIRDYLDGLTWDGVRRVDHWLSGYLGAGEVVDDEADDPDPRQRDMARQRGVRYLELVAAMTLIQAVARVRSPGCKADYVLILEGLQGRLKSTALKVLFGPEWFSDTPIDIGSKDAYESIRGLWCIELAELDSLNKADATRAKAFFSSASDRFRMPYGHRAQKFDRQCVVCGTTNQRQYLKDQTGNRRYWPVQCGEIDLEALAEVRDQLWAEADYRYRAGEPWWPQDADRDLFAEEQDARADTDVWEPLIQAYLHECVERVPPDGRALVFVTGAEIMRGALGMDPGAMRKPEQTRLGIIVQALGWRPARPTRAEGRVRGYRPGRAVLAAHVKAGVGDAPAF